MQKAVRTDLFKIPVSQVTVEEGFNIREDMGDLEALAKSIMATGQQQPATVAKLRGKEEYLLTDGHRRFAAIQLANEKFGANIEFLIAQKGATDEKSRTITMLLAGESKKLTDAEKLEGFNRLVNNFGLKPKEIVEMTGISQAGVYNTLQVNKAPEAIQQMVKDGKISIPAVNEIQRATKDPQEQVALAEDAVNNAQAEATATEGEKPKKATSSNSKVKKVSADIAKLEAALELVDGTSAKAANLKAIVNKLKKGASAEEIAKLLK